MRKLGKARYLKKVIAIALIMAMVITYLPISSVIAASTNLPQLSSQKISVKVGKTQKLQITNVKQAKVKSVKWSVNTAGSKIIKLTEKKTDSVTVKGLKAGTTTITVNIKTTKKNYTKKVKVVVKKADNTVTPTEAPVEYGDANTVSNYDKSKSNYALNVDASVKVHDISDMLYGCFFEDINFAADGGLYAELVQNRSFEFTKLAAGDQKHAWSNVGTVTANVVTDDTTGCLNENNPNYMVMENKSSSQAGIANAGFLEGMAVKGNAKYDFSIYAKGLDGYTGAVYVSITEGKNTLASGKIDAISSKWEKYELTLTPNATASSDVKLNVTIDAGKAAVDMVSLFPEDTYKNRKNGLRKDLAEKVADLSPAFLRFPVDVS